MRAVLLCVSCADPGLPGLILPTRELIPWREADVRAVFVGALS